VPARPVSVARPNWAVLAQMVTLVSRPQNRDLRIEQPYWLASFVAQRSNQIDEIGSVFYFLGNEHLDSNSLGISVDGAVRSWPVGSLDLDITGVPRI
jgi:hypothetical protein